MSSTTTGSRGPRGGGPTYQGELITVVRVRYPGKIRVVTVLLNSEDEWSDEDVRSERT